MSFGRELRKTPNRVRKRWYESGRATPTSSTSSSTMIVRNIPMITTIWGAPATASSAVTSAATNAGMIQKIGSSQARCERAMRVSPRKSMRPAVGS